MKRKLEEIFCKEPQKRVKLDDFQIQQELARGGRHDNSIWILTRRFLDLIREDHNLELDLKDSVRILQVPKCRIDDITNVLKGIGYIEKIGKNRVRWTSVGEELDEELKIIQKEIEELDEEEKTIQVLLDYLKQNVLHHQKQVKFTYLKFDDIKQCDEKLIQFSPLVIVTAPKGTIVEAPYDKTCQFPYQLHFDSSQLVGEEIGVYLCSCQKNPVEWQKRNG